jgi:hypothetical protein
MKFLDKWLFNKVTDMWENKHKYVQEKDYNEARTLKMGTAIAIDRGRPEGESRINFELSTAVGGKILNVRHYDDRKDRHDQQTYVIPNGEDVGERVAKIINLEMFRQ